MRILASAVAALAASALAATPASAAFTPGPFTISGGSGQIKIGKLATQSLNAADVKISGTIAADGAVSAPTAGIVLPSVTLLGATGRLVPTAAVTGRIDPTTGAVVSPLMLRFNIIAMAFGSTCTVTGGVLPLGSGHVETPSQANPTPPATVPFDGQPLNFADGSFVGTGLTAAPLARAEPATNFVCATINDQVGLPAVAGVRLAGRVTLPAVTKPVLAVTVRKPTTVRRGRTLTVRVRVRNTGNVEATGIRLSTKVPRGLKKPKTKRISTLAAGRSRTVNVRIVTRRSASRRPKLRFTVTATGGIKVVATKTVKLR